MYRICSPNRFFTSAAPTILWTSAALQSADASPKVLAVLISTPIEFLLLPMHPTILWSRGVLLMIQKCWPIGRMVGQLIYLWAVGRKSAPYPYVKSYIPTSSTHSITSSSSLSILSGAERWAGKAADNL